MDKKWIVIICIIILLAAGLLAYYSTTNQQKEVKIGEATFQLPNGYHVAASDDKNVTNLTNGTHNVYIKAYDDKNVKKYVDSYVNKSESNLNKTVKISNFTVGKTLVYKSNLKNSAAIHYWFVKNNRTYTIYSWNANPEIDSITTKLIESIS